MTEEHGYKFQQVHDWCQTQNFKNQTTEDLIYKFLIGCKFDIKTTKFKLKNYFEVRVKYVEWFQDRDPHQPELKELIGANIGGFLPVKDENGCVVTFMRTSAIDFNKHTVDDVVKLMVMGLDIKFEQDDTIVRNGMHIILDLNGITMYHILKLTPKIITRFVNLGLNCYPMKIKSVTVINTPWYAFYTWKVVRALLSKKLRKRLRVFSEDSVVLKKFYKPEILPNEYGGTLGCVDDIVEAWSRVVLEHRDMFLEN